MIGVIADDLTGAAEIGAVGARLGMRAELLLDGEPSADADLVCLDTDTRLGGPDEAAHRTRQAIARLLACGAGSIYKKTDSLLRGNPAAEISAMLDPLGAPAALLVPANPALGRTIVSGRYLVGDRPIHESEFAMDPSHPRASDVVTALAGEGGTQRVHFRAPGDPLPGSGIIIGGAADQEDLQHWATTHPEDWLMAGAAGFFEALHSRRWEGRPQVGEESSTLPPGELFVCGSTSDAAHAFIAAQRSAGRPVLSLPATLAEQGRISPEESTALARRTAAELGAGGRVVLQIGLPRVPDPGLSAQLPAILASVAAEALRLEPAGRVYAEGGATAVALARKMGWNRLRVLAELAPGVAVLAPAGVSGIRFTIKPGSYSWPEEVISGLGWDGAKP